MQMRVVLEVVSVVLKLLPLLRVQWALGVLLACLRGGAAGGGSAGVRQQERARRDRRRSSRKWRVGAGRRRYDGRTTSLWRRRRRRGSSYSGGGEIRTLPLAGGRDANNPRSCPGEHVHDTLLHDGPRRG